MSKLLNMETIEREREGHRQIGGPQKVPVSRRTWAKKQNFMMVGCSTSVEIPYRLCFPMEIRSGSHLVLVLPYQKSKRAHGSRPKRLKDQRISPNLDSGNTCFIEWWAGGHWFLQSWFQGEFLAHGFGVSLPLGFRRNFPREIPPRCPCRFLLRLLNGSSLTIHSL